ncbi:MAG: class I SAM-dependent methyltransferase [Porticoccus sp.]|nr:class I SAM-dependent methyltransferase [Porticoccus sp.]MBQ0806901.1 class I SAM-dependent methyltransferase [Porticoccus sp.]
MNEQPTSDYHVPETAFGKWFLRTNTWTTRVLEKAFIDLERLISLRKDSYSVVADVGCGYGRSLKKLHQRFSPQRLIGMDIDPEMIHVSKAEAIKEGIPVEFICNSCSDIKLDDNSVDLLFCHQTFHHLVLQEKSLEEFYRVLKPGGILLFAESTRRYIYSWLIRFLFRHPMDLQKTAEEYLAMVKGAGFCVPDAAISYPFLWWSREDLGIAENWLGIKPAAKHEETLINLVATKPI